MSYEEWFEFQVPVKIICGEKCVETVGLEIDKKGGRRALIVTDEQVEKAGLVDLVIEGMESGKSQVAGVFNQVMPDSEIDIVQRCYEFALDKEADCIVSVGGGSTIDTSKAVTILMVEGGHILDHHCALYMPRAPMPPHIAIPTTAGTGSEASFSAAILDKEQKLKLTYTSHELAPSVALLDPFMTRTLPADLTASTGICALSQCIEALHSQSRQPLCDGLAVQGIKLLSRYLPVAFKEPDNPESRLYTLIAANMGGIVFANASGGLIHALSNAVGARFGVPHGVAKAILLPLVMEFNIENYPDRVSKPYRIVAEALGIDTQGDDDVTAGKKAIEYIRNFISGFHLPEKLGKAGVEQESLRATAEDVMVDTLMLNSPVEPKLDELMGILKKAF